MGSTAIRLLVGVTVAMALASAPAHPAPVDRSPVVATTPGSVYFGYVPPVLVLEPGASLTFANFDSAEHDFVQDVENDGFGGPKNAPWCPKKKKGTHAHGHDHGHGCPAFYTPLLASAESAEVQGLDNLESGTTYTYFCTKHHNMKGTLIVR